MCAAYRWSLKKCNTCTTNWLQHSQWCQWIVSVLQISAGRTQLRESSMLAQWTSGWSPSRWASIRRTSPVLDMSVWSQYCTSVWGTDNWCHNRWLISIKWNTPNVNTVSEWRITLPLSVILDERWGITELSWRCILSYLVFERSRFSSVINRFSFFHIVNWLRWV